MSAINNKDNFILKQRLSLLSSHLINNNNNNNGSGNSGLIRPNSVCGIVAHVSKKPTTNTSKILMKGLKILMNRGYDSAGISTIKKLGEEDSELIVTKFASRGTTSDAIGKLSENLSRHRDSSIGIGHTRWATHGGKTDNNAHPHVDSSGRFALIHNGVIHNHASLKKELLKKQANLAFQSETDTEVVVQLIASYVLNEKLSVIDAIRKAVNRLEGTWGIILIDKENPNELYAFCNGSPLLIGIGNDEMFIASESSAFSQYTKSYIPLEDGEIVVVSSDGHSINSAENRIEQSPDEEIKASPEPWPHWTIKEIHEQPAAISRALNYGGRINSPETVKLGGLEDNKQRLSQMNHLIIGACGTSYHAGLYGARIMRYLHSFQNVRVIDAAEITPEDFPSSIVHAPGNKTSSSSSLNNGGASSSSSSSTKINEWGFLVLSQSGETKDVHRSLLLAESLGLQYFSIVNKVRSLIARFTSCGVYLNAGREHAVASTKAFTCQVIVLGLVAIWFSQQSPNTDSYRREAIVNSLHRASTLTGMVIRSTDKQCQAIAKLLSPSQHCFILGKGFAEPIAYEGSLKIKEITYLHAEGYAGGSLKHGPFALLDENVPVILIILNDQHLPFMETSAQEIQARKAKLIIITDLPYSKFSHLKVPKERIVRIPSNGTLTALLAIYPIQLIAYYLSVHRGINPDYPRHLAKTVTTD